MRISAEDKVSLILVLMAAASLVSMLATLNIDHIVNHDLYGYGLQFTTKWAVPYWTMSAIVFSMGWLIIVTSIGFELNLVVHRLRRHSEAEVSPVKEEPVQNETERIEAKSSDNSREEEVKEEVKETVEEKVNITALAVRIDDAVIVVSPKTEEKPANEE